MGTEEIVRVAAVADVHCGRADQGSLRPLFEQMAAAADVLLICGDLTERATPTRRACWCKNWPAIRACRSSRCWGIMIGKVGCDGPTRLRSWARQASRCWTAMPATVRGVGFAGVKGFAGGFGRAGPVRTGANRRSKTIVQEAMNEAHKLETALTRLPCLNLRVAVLHYAPISAYGRRRVAGVVAFPGVQPPGDGAGSRPGGGRLPRPRPRGQPGRHGWPDGTPVYNVALPLLRQWYPSRPPFHLLEVSVKRET